jgi:hypothetical protein
MIFAKTLLEGAFLMAQQCSPTTTSDKNDDKIVFLLQEIDDHIKKCETTLKQYKLMPIPHKQKEEIIKRESLIIHLWEIFKHECPEVYETKASINNFITHHLLTLRDKKMRHEIMLGKTGQILQKFHAILPSRSQGEDKEAENEFVSATHKDTLLLGGKSVSFSAMFN